MECQKSPDASEAVQGSWWWLQVMITFIKKILGINNLEYKIRLLERKNYWRDKYNGSKSINN